jgi:hypothetical protein
MRRLAICELSSDEARYALAWEALVQLRDLRQTRTNTTSQ